MTEYKLMESAMAKHEFAPGASDFVREIDRSGHPLPEDFGKALETMFLAHKGKCFFGAYFTDAGWQDVFDGGLPMAQGSKELGKVASITSTFAGLINDAKRSKRSTFVLAIPQEYLIAGENRPPILFNDNGVMRLLPEFIYGAIVKDGKGNASNFVYNAKYRSTHDYNAEGLEKASDSLAPIKESQPQPKKLAFIEWLKQLRKALPVGGGMAPSDTEEPEDHDDHDIPSGPNVVKF